MAQTHCDAETKSVTSDHVPKHTVVEGMPSKSQQQTARDTEFSPLSAFPCHHQHRIVQHDFRCATKMLFAVWIVDTAVWFLNVVASLVYFILSSYFRSTTFCLSIVWLPLFSILSFVAYYMFYTSTRMEDDTRFMISVVVILIEILTGLVAPMGIPHITAGFINGLSEINGGNGIYVAGIIMTFVGCLFAGIFIVHIAVLIVVLVAKCKHGTGYKLHSV